MTFVTKVTGDVFDAMVDVWDDRWSFTRSELGDVPDWADYVRRNGELMSESELEELHVGVVDETSDPVMACGREFCAGRVLREMDPTLLREMFLDWIGAQVSDGELRSIEGR